MAQKHSHKVMVTFIFPGEQKPEEKLISWDYTPDRQWFARKAHACIMQGGKVLSEAFKPSPLTRAEMLWIDMSQEGDSRVRRTDHNLDVVADVVSCSDKKLSGDRNDELTDFVKRRQSLLGLSSTDRSNGQA